MSDFKNIEGIRITKLLGWYLIAIAVISLDQVTKLWADEVLRGGPMVFTSFFQFELAYNTGAAFSFLHWGSGWQRWLFAFISGAVSIGISIWIAVLVKRRQPGRVWELLALSFILGGAIGNLIDRIAYGHVVDFISVHYQQYFFPTFNVADSAVCVGAGLLVLDMLFLQKDPHVVRAKRSDSALDEADTHV